MSAIDWNAPLELFDGTPAMLSDGECWPDEDGHYRVVPDGRAFFDHDDQEWGCSSRIYVEADGRWWLAQDGDEPIIRNRVLA